MKKDNQSWRDFKALIATPDLPALGPTPRAGRLPVLELNQKIDRFLADTNLNAALQASVRSAALLWHDYLDESHTISQNIPGADGSFLHGIMHRREQDYSNAKYWFHRVGRHPAFVLIATQAERLLDGRGEKELASSLVPGGHWDPFAFVDECELATRRSSMESITQALRAVQDVEFNSLLSHILSGSY